MRLKSFHQLTFAADNHSRKTLEPFVVRHFWLSIEPVSKQSDLLGRNFPRTNSVEQMVSKAGGRLCRRILGITLLPAVENANNGFANRCRFNSVIRFGHARRQLRQLLPAELPLSIELIGKTDHAELFFRIKAFDLLDNLLRCHAPMIWILLPPSISTANLVQFGESRVRIFTTFSIVLQLRVVAGTPRSFSILPR